MIPAAVRCEGCGGPVVSSISRCDSCGREPAASQEALPLVVVQEPADDEFNPICILCSREVARGASKCDVCLGLGTRSEVGEVIDPVEPPVERRRRSPLVVIIVLVLAAVLYLAYVFAPQLFGPGPAPIPEGGGAPAGTASGVTDEVAGDRPAADGAGATRKELMASEGLSRESPPPTDKRGSGVALSGSTGGPR